MEFEIPGTTDISETANAPGPVAFGHIDQRATTAIGAACRPRDLRPCSRARMRLVAACIAAAMLSCARAGEWYTTIEGCQIWNEFPQPNVSISWLGDCTEGKASGSGTSMWFYDSAAGQQVIDQYVGEMSVGKNHGTGSYYLSSGARYEGQWKDNRLHGHGTFQ